MKYIKVIWFNDSLEEPAVLFSELDEEGFEIRKVEVFKDGKFGFASKESHSQKTELGILPVPSYEEILESGEFVFTEIYKEEFEEKWNEALYY